MSPLQLQPLSTGQLVVQTARWVRGVGLALLCSGLVTLHTDLSRPRGVCCTPLYWNHDAAIHFSAGWCLLALLMVISTTQKLTLRGDKLQASWLWGVIHWTCPTEQVEIQEIELKARGGGLVPALRLKLGWLPLYVTPEFDGYPLFRRALRVAPDWPDDRNAGKTEKGTSSAP